MTPALFLGLGLLALPAVQVEGTSRCPRPDEVSSRLAELLPEAADADTPDTLRIEDVSGGVRLWLRRPDGTLLGQRILPTAASTCADVAAASAVVAAVWAKDAHPGFATGLPASMTARRPADLEARAPSAYDLGAGASGSLAPSSTSASAFGLTLAGSFIFSSPAARARWGLRAAAAGTALREQTLADGRVDWRRLTFALAPALRTGLGERPVPGQTAWWLDLHAGAIGSRLDVRGTGFTTNHDDATYEAGADAGVRLLANRGSAALWLDLSAATWLRDQLAIANPSGSVASLPRAEITLALGISFCACR